MGVALPCSWHYLAPVPTSYLPRAQHEWVLDRGSLTKRLILASKGEFKVVVLSQGWDYPTLDESIALAMPRRTLAWVREVELRCYDAVWVVARSVIPATTLTGKERVLMNLGNKPLGDFLFSSNTMRRGPLQITHKQGRLFKPSKTLKQHLAISARRSVFYLHNKPLLVSEFFLPGLFQHRLSV